MEGKTGARRHGITLGALAVVLAACNTPSPEAPPPAQLEQETAIKRETPVTAEPKDAELKGMVALAIADLVERQKPASLTDKDVRVVSAEHVTWRSAAIGCPLPDRGYLMVVTPGARIVLSAKGKVFEYHASRRGTPFLCEPPGKIETPVPATGSGALDRT